MTDRPASAESIGAASTGQETPRHAMRRAARALGVGLGLACVAVAPGQWQLARTSVCTPMERAAAIATGLLADAALLVAPCTLIAAVCLLARSRRVGRLTWVAFASLLWVSAVSVCESFASRGIFPSWVDVHLMWESPAMMRGSLDMFLARRWLVPSLALLPVALLLVVLWPACPSRPRPVAAAYALGLGTVLWLVVGSGARLLVGPAAAGLSPVGLLAISELPEAATCLLGPCEPALLLEAPLPPPLLEAAPPPPPGGSERAGPFDLSGDRAPRHAELARGAALLGWPSPDWNGRGAGIVAREFPSDEIGRGPPGRVEASAPVSSRLAVPERGVAFSEEPPTMSAAGLVEALGALSGALFAESKEPVDLWQIVLEGVRADDLHGLNPAAPAELTPWLTGLHAEAEAQVSGVFAGLNLWTAGLRTPHGLAALSCGLGTLPYGLTLARDLPRLPLRCLPDVLAAAGYSLRYAYGGTPAFDQMGPFLEAHGLEPWWTDPPPGRDPLRTGWGVTDRALLGALPESADDPRPSYRMVITLSHHHPFVAPGDLSAEVRERAEKAFSIAGTCATEGDLDRLITLAYTDAVLGEWFTGLERTGRLDRSIVAISADHPIPGRSLWRHRPGAFPSHRTPATVPFLLWISPKLILDAADGAEVQRLGETVARELAERQLSQNDVPTLLLALLEHAPRVRDLPLADRWHSMGGQTTSPWYRASCGPRGRVHGIHAGTALFCVDDAGEPAAREEPVPLVVTWSRAHQVAPSLQAAGALLGALGRVHAPLESVSAISTK